MSSELAVMLSNASTLNSKLRGLASELSLPLISSQPLKHIDQYHHVLTFNKASYLALQQTGKKASGSIFVDFTKGTTQYRKNISNAKNELLIKATGILKINATNISVLDTTAGFGVDGFLLATAGCHVTMLERSPIVHALLNDGLYRGSFHDKTADVIQRIELHLCDAIHFLSQKEISHKKFDIVFLDPMFPTNKKSALARKEMNLLQNLLSGKGNNEAQLLQLAKQSAAHRVVIKRPSLAPYFANVKPSFTFKGRTIRFDCYV